ncbi:MAG: hypothetical protein JST00_45665 [Deltaproteobacteria bacterium]|nr:hypothetical protein [Deltaproteobacteria bacterium]
MKAKLLALGLLATLAAYGCASQTSEDDQTQDEAESQDELILRKGSVDHAAIVEVTTMMLASGPQSPLLDPYNQEDPFAIRGGEYLRTFDQRIGQFDAIDGRADWKPEQRAAWTARVTAGNYQILDTSKPCDFYNPHSYLEIERAKLTGRTHATCGGRNPNEDALDVTANFLVRGPSASMSDAEAIHDGVANATKPAEDAFPYLAEMNGF